MGQVFQKVDVALRTSLTAPASTGVADLIDQMADPEKVRQLVKLVNEIRDSQSR